MIRRRAALTALAALIVLVVALLAASCGSDDGPDVDEARLRVEGAVTLTAADGVAEVLTGERTLAFGDAFVVDEGTATLELAGGQTYEFRAGPVPSHVEVGAPPTLLAGDALVTAGFPAAIRYETATLSAQGAVKISAEVPSATAYAGRTRISGSGELDGVEGLRQVVVTSSAVPEPLIYDPADDWDRRYLGEAIAFGERLEALARGFTNDLQSGSRSADFYRSVLPALAVEREFGADLIGDRPAGETLVGATIAIQGRTGTFRERWDAVFAFRDEGAAWGLVALDQGVSSAPVLATIELAIGASPPPSDSPEQTPTTGAPSPPSSAPTTPTPPTPPPPPPPRRPRRPSRTRTASSRPCSPPSSRSSTTCWASSAWADHPHPHDLAGAAEHDAGASAGSGGGRRRARGGRVGLPR